MFTVMNVMVFVPLPRHPSKGLSMTTLEVWQRVDALLMADDPSAAFEAYRVSGDLKRDLPEVDALYGFHLECEAHHKDLWDHTLRVIANCPRDADIRWVGLMHDVGKVPTRAFDERGRVTFWKHEEVGSDIFGVICERIGMPSHRAERIGFLIANHGRFNAFRAEWSDKAIRRLIRDSKEHLEGLLAFSAADYTTSRPTTARKIARRIQMLRDRIDAVRADTGPPALPNDFGASLMAALDWRPGPHVGEAIEWVRVQIKSGALPEGGDALTYIEAVRAR